jgi:DNA topoisomerase VI subunit A
MNNEEYKRIYDSVKIGNEEIIIYNGYPEVPKRLNYEKVKVIGFTKKKVKVTNGYETINVRYDQIKRVREEILKVSYF